MSSLRDCTQFSKKMPGFTYKDNMIDTFQKQISGQWFSPLLLVMSKNVSFTNMNYCHNSVCMDE